jgi:hypothetical protein
MSSILLELLDDDDYERQEEDTWSNASTLHTEELQEHYDSDTYSSSEVAISGSDESSSWDGDLDNEDEHRDSPVQNTFRGLNDDILVSSLPVKTVKIGRRHLYRPTQRVALLDLSTEILERIFTHLAPRTAVTFTLLCKKLYTMSQAKRGRAWRLLIARQLGRNYTKLEKPKLSKLLSQYAWEICDSPDDHFGRRVKRYRKSDYRLCSPCRVKLDWDYISEDSNEFTRRHVLETAMDMYSISPRADSKLCTDYIEKGEGYVSQIVKTM